MKNLELALFLILSVSAFSGDFSGTPVSFEDPGVNNYVSNYDNTGDEANMLENDNVSDQSTRYWLLTVRQKLNDVETVVHYVSVPSAISSLLVILLLIIRAVYGIGPKKQRYQVRPNILHPDEIVHLRRQTFV